MVLGPRSKTERKGNTTISYIFVTVPQYIQNITGIMFPRILSRTFFSSIAGVSRSSTMVAAYLLTVTKVGWQEAIEAIRCCRHVANPNFGFQRQLQEFEVKGRAAEVSAWAYICEIVMFILRWGPKVFSMAL